MNSSEKKLTKGIYYVLLANFITICINIITNFLLPKKLSVTSYADIKTFQLYMNYVGVFHLGFVDGIYLRYGGRNIDEISGKELKKNSVVLTLFETFVTIITILFSYIIHDNIVFIFALSIVPINLVSMYKMIYQATGDFKKYKSVTNITALLMFFSNLILCLIVKTDISVVYLLSYVIIDYIILILVLFLNRRTQNNPKFKESISSSINEFIHNVRIGFSLMCGNLASFILTGMDRWFVKFTMNNTAFAQYSFSVSIENMLGLAITPISIPLYNYFCKEKNTEKIYLAHKCIILFSSVIVCVAFFAQFAIIGFLPAYSESLTVIFILFCAQGIQIPVKSIYVNLYKAQKMQKKYFVKLTIVLISGVIFNYFCYKILKTKEAYAWGTLLSSILWFGLSITDFKDIFLNNINDFIFLLLELACFLFCGLMLPPLSGFILYSLCTFVLTYFLIGKHIKKIPPIIKNMLKK